jgi:hypothetical protein
VHRTWDDAEHADTGWHRSFSMHNDFTFLPIRKATPLSPGEVVVILDVEQDLDAQRPRNVRVNERVIRRRIPAHQLHRRPVLLASFSR